MGKGTFQIHLKWKRESEGWTQAQLAKRAGFQPTAISHFESGARSPSANNLAKLAKALNTSMDYLWGEPE